MIALYAVNEKDTAIMDEPRREEEKTRGDNAARKAGMGLGIFFALLLLIFLIVRLHSFIGPTTPTEKKDFVQLLVVIFGGLIGFAGAYFAWGNLRHNQRTLQFTQDNEAQKAQDAALQEYVTQIGNLLFNNDIPVNEKTHLLVRMHTLTIFRRLDGSRKGSTLMFQYGLRLLDRQKEQNESTIDLSRADLSEAHLSSRDLSRADLSGTDLSRADLRETILFNADLRGTILSETKLQGADLSCADLRDAESLTQEQLEQAKGNRVTQVPNYLSYPKTKWGFDSSGVVLPNADLNNADLRCGVLHSSDLQEAKLQEANLKEADLKEANLQDADLRGAKLQGADLQGAKLRGANLQGAFLQGANLKEAANLQGANLQGADLQEVDLQGANLQGKDLKRTSFRESDLQGADLQEAKLHEANLRGAKLQGANLFRANLYQADLKLADLSDALRWTEDQLAAARHLGGATMPDGQKYEDWRKDKEGSGKDLENE
jgi:uncharacterized protein YjbI with pentapeptide repeats